MDDKEKVKLILKSMNKYLIMYVKPKDRHLSVKDVFKTVKDNLNTETILQLSTLIILFKYYFEKMSESTVGDIKTALKEVIKNLNKPEIPYNNVGISFPISFESVRDRIDINKMLEYNRDIDFLKYIIFLIEYIENIDEYINNLNVLDYILNINSILKENIPIVSPEENIYKLTGVLSILSGLVIGAAIVNTMNSSNCSVMFRSKKRSNKRSVKRSNNKVSHKRSIKRSNKSNKRSIKCSNKSNKRSIKCSNKSNKRSIKCSKNLRKRSVARK